MYKDISKSVQWPNVHEVTIVENMNEYYHEGKGIICAKNLLELQYIMVEINKIIRYRKDICKKRQNVAIKKLRKARKCSRNYMKIRMQYTNSWNHLNPNRILCTICFLKMRRKVVTIRSTNEHFLHILPNQIPITTAIIWHPCCLFTWLEYKVRADFWGKFDQQIISNYCYYYE